MARRTDRGRPFDITGRFDVSNNDDLELGRSSHHLPLISAQQHLERTSSSLIYGEFGEWSVAQDKPVPSHVSQPSSTKRAISRIPRPAIEPSNRRVSRACDPCREQKAKCSGHQPRCQRCHATGAICVYTDGKRAREAKSGYPFI
jgi:hypothetical protein